jgi:phosphoribosylanthranilate isomerase
MNNIKIKVCGLRDPLNIEEVASLKPQFMGFIMYDRSPRYVNPDEIGKLVKNIPDSIQRVGVLVNKPLKEAVKISQSGVFDLIQLHGNESPGYCRIISQYVEVIKAFSISYRLPVTLSDYQPYCRLLLFDSQGQRYGGTGRKFDHSILDKYSLHNGYILSGGISPADSDYIKSIHSDKMIAVDLNSRFELRPGIKDVVLIKKFIDNIRNHDIEN